MPIERKEIKRERENVEPHTVLLTFFFSLLRLRLFCPPSTGLCLHTHTHTHTHAHAHGPIMPNTFLRRCSLLQAEDERSLFFSQQTHQHGCPLLAHTRPHTQHTHTGLLQPPALTPTPTYPPNQMEKGADELLEGEPLEMDCVTPSAAECAAIRGVYELGA